MNQFKIKATRYSEAGAITNDYSVFYFGTADIAETKFDELNRQRQTDTEGHDIGKAYKVELEVLTFKKVENPTEFFAQFKI